MIVGQAWAAQAGGTGRVLTAVGLDVTKPLVDRLAAQEARLAALERQLRSIQQQLPSSTPSNVDVH
jgi:predicted alpha/beta hydrolase